MLNHFMAELGCDYPQITLKLDRNYLPAGEMLIGNFFFWPEILQGTDKPIDLEFVLLAQFEHDIKENIIDVLQTDDLIITAESAVVMAPFRYQLPKWLPVSTHAIRYYLRPKLPHTHITIQDPGVPADSFFGLPAIIVQPNQLQRVVMDVLFSLGCQEKLDSRYWDGAAQEFDFSASRGKNDDNSEFTLTFHAENDHVLLSLQQSGEKPVQLRIPQRGEEKLSELTGMLAKALQKPNS